MAISPIGYTPHFTGKAKTDKGNEYQTTNTGKIVGTTAGTLLGGAHLWRANKMFDKAFKHINEEISEIGPQDADEILKTGKKIGKGICIVGASIGALFFTVIGFFAGKVYDNKQNSKNADAADKDANV